MIFNALCFALIILEFRLTINEGRKWLKTNMQCPAAIFTLNNIT